MTQPTFGTNNHYDIDHDIPCPTKDCNGKLEFCQTVTERRYYAAIGKLGTLPDGRLMVTLDMDTTIMGDFGDQVTDAEDDIELQCLKCGAHVPYQIQNQELIYG